jgi:segregation and condensation protein B
MDEIKESELESSEEADETSKIALNLATSSSQTIEEIEDLSEHIKKIEAALFISGRYLNMQELITLTDLNPILIKELIEKLKDRYSADDTAISLIEKDNAWKMDVKQDFVGMINKLATGSSEFTKAEQETLAVIAYKQPVKQSVIIKIRGNKAYEHIKNFISLGLVKSKKQGHTLELNLSEDFYDYFHLGSKDRKDVEKVEEEEEEKTEE